MTKHPIKAQQIGLHHHGLHRHHGQVSCVAYEVPVNQQSSHKVVDYLKGSVERPARTRRAPQRFRGKKGKRSKRRNQRYRRTARPSQSASTRDANDLNFNAGAIFLLWSQNQ